MKAQTTVASGSALPQTEMRQRAEEAPAAGLQHPHTTQPGVTWQQLSNRLINAGYDLLKLAKLDGDPQLMKGHEALHYVIGLVDECAGEERAEQKAAQTDAEARQTGTTLTAAQRGSEWVNRWGCPGFCVVPHGEPLALECHSTAPVETSLLAAEIDSSGYSANGEGLPWMTAQIVVHNEQEQTYGRRTQVWLGYGVHLAEISPAEARKALDAMRAFTVRLAAVVDLAEQVAADDFEGDPEIAAADHESENRGIKARAAELLVAEGRA